ncbi:MAG TPA: J domain-containing protein, partial [Ktedonobacteraceae bacterium]|nr:J domain-containing protein [Ktedonobacteraceae bacterium]
SPYSQGTHQTRTPPKPTWATILGVESTATKDQIKARYRELAKQNHPDRGGDPVKFAKITEAYEQATR